MHKKKPEELLRENERLREKVHKLEKERSELHARNREHEEELSKCNETINDLIYENDVLKSLSERDLLTNLLNRRGLESQMKRVLSRMEPKEVEIHRKGGGWLKDVSVLFLDIDHFKKVNDTFGHTAGDEALKSVAEHLSSNLIFGHSLREDDVVARWGGEEFVLVFPGTELSEIKEWLTDEKSHKFRRIEIPVTIWGNSFTLTLSGGLTDYREGEDFWKDTLPRADRAAYRAKLDGRNKIYVGER